VTRAVARCGPETKQVRKANRKLSDNIEVEPLVLIRNSKYILVCLLGSAKYMYIEFCSKVRRRV
jgi:hypothetical protein